MTMTSELSAVKRFLNDLCGGKDTSVLCAVSGGLDSMCLLHLLSDWGRTRNITVTAAHFNHRLRGAESDGDEAFVRKWCGEHGIPFVSESGDVAGYAAETGQSIEEAARTARYAFLERQRQATGCAFVLTAHHADDNAETMLLHLLRGTGSRGLAGIPPRRGAIARPFLSVTRAELAAYAQEHQILFVEDSTNALDEVSRNVLRHKVLPVLRELNPKAVENMTRTAQQLRRDEDALTSMAEALLERCCREECDALYLDAEACLAAAEAVFTRAVHAALAQKAGGRRDLTAAHVEAVCALLYAVPGKTASLPYGLTARRDARELVIAGAEPTPQAADIAPGETVRFGTWRVMLAADGPGRPLSAPEGARLTVTSWDRNDRMTLPGSRGERSLKRLCADAGISPAQRDAMPVLRVDGQAAAVPGVGIDAKFAPNGSAKPIYVIFHQETEEKNDEK
ncbi:MAG: tRNA lysidine(34) synthetase TilS [Ruminococcaceae bacterium]|nr:tRNA lysidine(34) synthetase TilS [Oscillospiraceae bacterium]